MLPGGTPGGPNHEWFDTHGGAGWGAGPTGCAFATAEFAPYSGASEDRPAVAPLTFRVFPLIYVEA